MESKQFLEGLSEVVIEERVEERVEGRVDVAQPDDEGGDVLVQVAAVLAQAAQHVHEGEGHPADEEAGHDQQHALGGPLLSQLEAPPHAGRHVVAALALPRQREALQARGAGPRAAVDQRSPGPGRAQRRSALAAGDREGQQRGAAAAGSVRPVLLQVVGGRAALLQLEAEGDITGADGEEVLLGLVGEEAAALPPERLHLHVEAVAALVAKQPRAGLVPLPPAAAARRRVGVLPVHPAVVQLKLRPRGQCCVCIVLRFFLLLLLFLPFPSRPLLLLLFLPVLFPLRERFLCHEGGSREVSGHCTAGFLDARYGDGGAAVGQPGGRVTGEAGLLLQVVRLFVQHGEDLHVEEGHEAGGQDEGAHGRVDDVALAAEEDAHVAVDGRVVDEEPRDHVLPADEGRQGDDDGEDPHEEHVGQGLPRRPLVVVPHGVHGGRVAVEGDGAEPPDGGGAVEDVDGEPDGAHGPAEDPVAQQVVGDGDGQHCDGQKQVRHGQVADQAVGHGAQVAVPAHIYNYTGRQPPAEFLALHGSSPPPPLPTITTITLRN